MSKQKQIEKEAFYFDENKQIIDIKMHESNDWVDYSGNEKPTYILQISNADCHGSGRGVKSKEFSIVKTKKPLDYFSKSTLLPAVYMYVCHLRDHLPKEGVLFSDSEESNYNKMLRPFIEDRISMVDYVIRYENNTQRFKALTQIIEKGFPIQDKVINNENNRNGITNSNSVNINEWTLKMSSSVSKLTSEVANYKTPSGIVEQLKGLERQIKESAIRLMEERANF